MKQTSVELRDVRKSYGSLQVVHGIDLAIDEGEFVVFVGPSGCGKSTLLRMIAGLEDVTSGEIVIKGRDVTDLDPSERGIAMVFQSYALYPHMSVRDNLGFGLKMANTDAAEIARRVGHASGVLKIDHLLDRRPGQLSGGQRQRVAIGRAIVREPDVFLFDEPLSNLDAELRVSMRIEIAKLHRKLANTMIYVTHDQTEAMTLADKIVVLRDGRIEQTGTPREVYENPANVFVAGFIGSPRMNLLNAVWRGDGQLTVGGQNLPAEGFGGQQPDIGDKLIFGIRPEHFQVTEGSGAIRATVEFTEYLGGLRYVYCTLADGQSLVVEQRDGPDIEEGQEIALSAPSDKCRYFDEAGIRMR
ncbi:sn-glycerol-3-phosphate ABC transporter ATP-binding protein UgpC (plasmid) [Rhizobium grahamii]|uniref:sn-glycerol-3-phosphate ABC transporter ATP-binding protein UgpC n=1 Tax=Rhizobium grahamii TaxID=1120045 RepID=A0A5Q0CHK4_9HYPH|nr:MULTISPECIES: sn-glycerol-3-phosphate ABC transporter ATP-binding protein UgpC [Rhizobium]QFY63719.1 sn-glycerol-3-phosphate ABC transporter ATP-binding protein UgpC [Rhizobium grahamii]QRM51518.1 sn-glycerol-3-phosphate ABC transporter ATP-binding protein UgpC [Rhizobium sp. BG6]